MFLKSVISLSLATALSGTCAAHAQELKQPMPLASPLFNKNNSAEPALDILRQLNRNPAVAHSAIARREVLMTTGSVVKSNGKSRVLYHLPATKAGLRLHGEAMSLEWPINIAREQLNSGVLLRVAYKNAVSVMPEASGLSIEVNGVMIGQSTIQSPTKSRILEFKVPASVLVPGVNALRISARQRHRVDCSVRATHELWTDIDSAKTGFIFERGNSSLKTIDSLAAIARNKAGQVKMRLLTNSDRTASQVERVMSVAQHAAIHAHFENPQVDVATTAGKGPGLDVFTGTLQQLRAIAPDYAKRVNGQGGLQLLSRDGEERLALILITGEVTSSANDTAFHARLANLFPKSKLIGSAQGLTIAKRASENKVEEGEKLTFSDLGLQSEEFDGRLYRGAFNVQLPADYFSADYNRAEINLATGYASGLDRNNKFVVRVNGVTATGFALSNPAGKVYRNKMLRVPLSSFKPGHNRIEIEAQLQNASDRDCEPMAQIGGKKRFVLSGNSTIKFPRLARLARLPNLAGTVSAGFPYVLNGKAVPTVLSVPNPDYPSLSAAAGFITHVATRAGIPLDVDLKYSAPRGDVESAIVISPLAQLPKKLSNDITGIDMTRLQTAWKVRGNAARARQLAVLDLQTEGGVDTFTTAGISNSDVPEPNFNPSLSNFNKDSDPINAWDSTSEERDDVADERLTFSGHVASMFRSFLGMNGKSVEAKPRIENVNSDLLITQKMGPSSSGVWTVVTAPSNQALKSGVSLMVKPDVASRISGETVTLNGIDRTVTSSVTSQNYVQVSSFSLRNIQLIVAGWFSNNHHVFSLLLLGILLGFGLVSNRLLGSVGVDRSVAEERDNG